MHQNIILLIIKLIKYFMIIIIFLVNLIIINFYIDQTYIIFKYLHLNHLCQLFAGLLLFNLTFQIPFQYYYQNLLINVLCQIIKFRDISLILYLNFI